MLGGASLSYILTDKCLPADSNALSPALFDLCPELLALCKENRDSLPMYPKEIVKAGFFSNDFDFFLSKTPNSGKYALSAFYGGEMEYGK